MNDKHFHGFQWALIEAKKLKDRARDNHKEIDYFQMHPKPLAELKKRLGDEKGVIFNGDLSFFSIKIKPNEHQGTSEVTCQYKGMPLWN